MSLLKSALCCIHAVARNMLSFFRHLNLGISSKTSGWPVLRPEPSEMKKSHKVDAFIDTPALNWSVRPRVFLAEWISLALMNFSRVCHQILMWLQLIENKRKFMSLYSAPSLVEICSPEFVTVVASNPRVLPVRMFSSRERIFFRISVEVQLLFCVKGAPAECP